MEWLLRLRVILAPASAFDPWRWEQGSQSSLCLFVILKLRGKLGQSVPTNVTQRHPRPAI